MLYRRGVSHDDVLAALDAVDEEISDDERREDPYLSGLAHYVAALGGRIELSGRVRGRRDCRPPIARRGLIVATTPVQGASGIWEMTGSMNDPDGRATWEWTEVAGEAAIRWRRVGNHEVLDQS